MAKSRTPGEVECEMKTGKVTWHFTPDHNPFFYARKNNNIVITHYNFYDDFLNPILDDLDEIDPQIFYNAKQPLPTEFYPVIPPASVRFLEKVPTKNDGSNSREPSSLRPKKPGQSSSLFHKSTIHQRNPSSLITGPGPETKYQPNQFQNLSIPTPKNMPPISPFSEMGSPTKGDPSPYKKRW